MKKKRLYAAAALAVLLPIMALLVLIYDHSTQQLTLRPAFFEILSSQGTKIDAPVIVFPCYEARYGILHGPTSSTRRTLRSAERFFPGQPFRIFSYEYRGMAIPFLNPCYERYTVGFWVVAAGYKPEFLKTDAGEYWKGTKVQWHLEPLDRRAAEESLKALRAFESGGDVGTSAYPFEVRLDAKSRRTVRTFIEEGTAWIQRAADNPKPD